MTDIAGLFGPDGALSRLPGFAARAVQQAMAQAAEAAFADAATLVVEAGTGAGKTWAYLVPALLSGRKVIVSTGTRALQDQIWEHDLPRLRAALGSPARTALLKGRANYVCLHRLDAHLRHPAHTAHAPVLTRISRQVAEHDRGEVSDFPDVPPQDPVWPLATSTAENCLGSECPVFSECFLVRARRAAQAADVVIVNHHLLLSDWALRAGSGAEVLPDADALVCDEAHLLPELAVTYFGIGIGSNQLTALARDARTEAQAAQAGPAVADGAAAVEDAAMALVRALPPGSGRVPFHPADAAFAPALHAAAAALAELGGVLDLLADHGAGLARCARRAGELRERLAQLRADDDETGSDGDEDVGRGASVSARVHCAERRERSVSLHAYPLDPGPEFAAALERYRGGRVFTSATLAVAGNFAHFQGALGLADARTLALPGTHDYARQALLYLPADMPDPQSGAWDEAVLRCVADVLTASDGRAFLLCTSRAAVARYAAALRTRWNGAVLAQEDAPPARLLERFRSQPRAVLVGAASFWQGVDVPGPALSCVIVDRLPFAAPGDPVLAARIAHLRAQGRDPFRDHQLPHAVLTLRQGLGRLLRGPDDRGVLVVCDPRLRGKSYGRVFLASLPPVPQTRALDDVHAFFAAADAAPVQTQAPPPAPTQARPSP